MATMTDDEEAHMRATLERASFVDLLLLSAKDAVDGHQWRRVRYELERVRDETVRLLQAVEPYANAERGAGKGGAMDGF